MDGKGSVFAEDKKICKKEMKRVLCNKNFTLDSVNIFRVFSLQVLNVVISTSFSRIIQRNVVVVGGAHWSQDRRPIGSESSRLTTAYRKVQCG